MEQVQRTAIMLDINIQIDKFYITMLTQFSYVSLYHGILPLSSLFLFASNLAVIFITERMYSYITKRSLSQQMSDIGTWNDVFEAVGLLCIIGSAMITTYTTDSLDRYFDGNKEIALLVIIAAEHVVLGLRYLMTKIVSSVPGWLSKQMRYREIMKNTDERVKMMVKETAANFLNLMPFGGLNFTSVPEKKLEEKSNPLIVQNFYKQSESQKQGEKSVTPLTPGLITVIPVDDKNQLNYKSKTEN